MTRVHLASQMFARHGTVLIAALAFVALLVACGTGSAKTAGSTNGSLDGPSASADLSLDTVEAAGVPRLPVTVSSADGRPVTITDVSRIVVLKGNIAEVVFALGLGNRVVGRDISATFPEIEHVALVTRAHDVSAESVLSLRPTLVLADTESGPPEAIDHIRNVGVPLVRFTLPTTVAEIGPRIEAIATALGVQKTGTALATKTTAAVDQTRGAVPAEGRPRVAFLYMRGQAGVYLMGGKGSGADSMIDAAGGIDAGTSIGLERAFTPITSEALVAAAPDVILMTTTGLASVGGIEGLVGIPGIAQTPAGRDRRVATVEDGLLFSFGVRTPDALASLSGQLRTDSPSTP